MQIYNFSINSLHIIKINLFFLLLRPKTLSLQEIAYLMKNKFLFIIAIIILITTCHQNEGYKVVICIPVYGQSLALGEEAERITDFDSLAAYADGRIVTQNMDHAFGYFDNDDFKEWAKKTVRYQKRSYELSVYNMAKILADNTGKDTLICIFPGGQGATAIANLSKGTEPYQNFIDDIETAFNEATDKGWKFVIPAICWMQGESDIVDYPKTDYKKMITKIWNDMNEDILRITGQNDSIRFICYQPNSLTRAEHFKAERYECKETIVPQTFVDLLSKDNRFWASGPTYPYHCVGEKIHIDAIGQQQIGTLAANSVLGILRGKERFCGFIPLQANVEGNDVTIHFNVPTPPMTIDTIQVMKAGNYGFSVINNDNRNIINRVEIENNIIKISCSESPIDCKIRYAVNGEYMKSGNIHGPRGNLRDSRGNWCYQFEIKAD